MPTVVTCLAGRGTRRAVGWAVARVPADGRAVVVWSRRPRPVGAAGRQPAAAVRIHLLDATGALVPFVLDDPDRR